MLNTITFQGRLGSDPEVRSTAKGTTITSFRLANNKRVKGVDHTTWRTCKCWGPVGDTAGEHLRKGQEIIVEGEIRDEEWEDRDGNKRVTPVINVRAWHFTGSRDTKDTKDRPAYAVERSHSESQASQEIPF